MTGLKVPGLPKPLSLERIVWVQADSNYSRLHLTCCQTHLVTQTLKWFEDHLNHFIRINKSALVNPIHVVLFQQATNRMAQLQLDNGYELIVSRRRIGVVVSRLALIGLEPTPWIT